jgi:hypothetical protein
LRCSLPGLTSFLGGFGCQHEEKTRPEYFSYLFSPEGTRKASTDRLRRFGKATLRTVLDRLAHAGCAQLSEEARGAVAEALDVARVQRQAFWRTLLELHAVSLRGGRWFVAVPRVPITAWHNYLRILRRIGDEINARVADSADDLRARARRCSFADCDFNDSVFVFCTFAESFVKEAVVRRLPPRFPKEADFGWGAFIAV